MDFVLDRASADYGAGFYELLKERGYSCTAGICVTMKKGEQNCVRVCCDGSRALIEAPETVFLFRGLMTLVMRLEREGQEKRFLIEEEIHLDENGVMVDCSRNCVMSLPAVKAWIRMQASVGMNLLMLYTEDTYEVPEYPYFGAFRGRFKKEELRELDRYAQQFGIELIPCIQTLGHLQHALRWEAMKGLRDTGDILMVGEEKVYDFIRACMKQAMECFSTRRIHLGMDEAWTLGLGKYLVKNGYRSKNEIILEHLDRVMALCRELGLEPMIWSDMYFRVHSETEEYYDVPFDTDMTTKAVPPEGMALVYWDYYHMDEAFYRAYIRLHRQIAEQVIFAGGGWTWNGIAPNLKTGYAVTHAGLSACRKENVRRVLFTLWGDDGTETPLYSGLGPVLLAAEYGFGDVPARERIREKFEFLTGCSFGKYEVLGAFDNFGWEPTDTTFSANPSKLLLYQDVLAGLYDGQLEGIPVGGHYGEMEKKMENQQEEEAMPFLRAANTFWGKEMSDILQYYRELAHVLSCKADLGLRIRAAYLADDREQLQCVAGQEIPELIRSVDRCRMLRETVWMAEGSIFGWEVLDIRFRALSGRLESAAARLEQYLDGRIPALPEVEEPRPALLPAFGGERRLQGGCNSWINTVSASPLAWGWMPQ